MSRNITQEELELARYGLVIAQLHLNATVGILKSVENISTASLLDSYCVAMESLCKRIFAGEIVGTQ